MQEIAELLRCFGVSLLLTLMAYLAAQLFTDKQYCRKFWQGALISGLIVGGLAAYMYGNAIWVLATAVAGALVAWVTYRVATG